MFRQRIKIGNARRGSRVVTPPAPALVLTLTGTTLTWSPRDSQATAWAVKAYDLSGRLLDDTGYIDGSQVNADIRGMWDPPPFQVSLQAQDNDGVNFGPESNKIIWNG